MAESNAAEVESHGDTSETAPPSQRGGGLTKLLCDRRRAEAAWRSGGARRGAAR
jgi:hypothetical protein